MALQINACKSSIKVEDMHNQTIDPGNDLSDLLKRSNFYYN